MPKVIMSPHDIVTYGSDVQYHTSFVLRFESSTLILYREPFKNVLADFAR